MMTRNIASENNLALEIFQLFVWIQKNIFSVFDKVFSSLEKHLAPIGRNFAKIQEKSETKPSLEGCLNCKIYKSLRLGGPINDTIRSAIRKMKEKDSSGSTKLSPVEFKYYLENHVMEDLVKRFEAGSNYPFEDEGGLHLCQLASLG